MKADWSKIDEKRVNYPGSLQTEAGDRFGVFKLTTGKGASLLCIVDDGKTTGWEHVSVHVEDRGEEKPSRCPSWNEMCYVKRTFWDDSETVVQFHPKQEQYINNHSFVLHLWKRVQLDYTLPPSCLV